MSKSMNAAFRRVYIEDLNCDKMTVIKFSSVFVRRVCSQDLEQSAYNYITLTLTIVLVFTCIKLLVYD